MQFDAIYETDCEADPSHRVITAESLNDAKAVLKAQIEEEANHGNYRLVSLWETHASFEARMKARMKAKAG